MPDLPFGASGVGHYVALPGFRDPVAVKDFVEVFWGVSGTGALVIDGMERRLKPNQVALYFPGMRHQVYALDEAWEYVWWCMDGPLAASLTTAFGLTASVYDAGPTPLALLHRLMRTIQDPSPEAERQASVLAFQLLTLAAAGPKPRETPPVDAAIRIIHHEWHQPDLCIKEIANRLGIHRTRLTRRFEATVGIPPLGYLTRIRIQNALSLLRQTDKTIAEVALLCGYGDPNYLSRLIRRFTGLSPRGFRRDNAPRSAPPPVTGGSAARASGKSARRRSG